MRLFHVSEEENIQLFEPRLPERNDLDKSVGLVWAIDEARLPNFLPHQRLSTSCVSCRKKYKRSRQKEVFYVAISFLYGCH